MSATLFLKELRKNKDISSIEKAVKTNKLPIVVWGATDAVKAPVVSLLSNNEKSSLVIVPEGTVDKYKKLLYPFYHEKIAVFTAKDYVFSDLERLSFDDVFSRTAALYCLKEKGFAVITTAEAVMQFTAEKEFYNSNIITFKVGENWNFEELYKKLLSAGYKRVDKVEGVGQFAKRGDIFDVWSPLSAEPARIEFFDEEIEKISAFDTFSQRKKVALPEYIAIPASETKIEENAINIIKKQLNFNKIKIADNEEKSFAEKAVECLENGFLPDGADRLIPALYSQKNTVFDYFSENSNLFVFEHKAVFDNAKAFINRINDDLKYLAEKNVSLLKGDYYLPETELYSRLKDCKAIILDSLSGGINAVTVKETVSLNISETSAWHGNLDILCEDVIFYAAKGFKIFIAAANSLHAEKIKEKLTEKLNDGIKISLVSNTFTEFEKGVNIGISEISEGFLDNSVGFVLFADKKDAVKRTKKALKRYKDTKQITSLELLKKGDYIVHNDYGIGVFEGVVTSESNGITRDMLRILYAGTDVLYVPCDRLDLIAKYSGADVTTANIKLSKLGGNDWQNTKNKVRAAVKTLAFDLTSLYAERLKTPGHAFTKDTLWQTEFEESFQFEETDDQLRVIKEVKKDMEKPVAMDRLICGDVGVGKTEVAIRAVFKCVSDGKQAAILVPTTVLAWQHYRTFLSRFADYPIKVEMLSRFVSETEKKKIIKRLKTGETDVVIGTHSLIQKNVNFKDLGLLIIDEEQRFGVGHKETLKEKYKNVDCITLSATPIPRTLNMALSGIRDMSIIEDYPEDRQPIKTYMAEYDENLVLTAISKELSRGGQVYYLSNRVDTIYQTAEKISKLLPEASIDVAHGQMKDEELSLSWEKLLKKETDILVCTTIIETGIDVSNVNTVIIEDADNLGLAQLHQIRGRVGRSPRRAYCYLLYKKNKILTEDAAKRLNSIRDFTEFGAGLKIALRDLEIRGAGSVLGANQHGHIANVGYDMYLNLLETAISEQKGEKAPPEKCNIAINVNAFIPQEYIEAVEDRIVIYKKLASISEIFDSDEIKEELTDRFGKIPPEVLNLIAVSEIKFIAEQCNITQIKEEQNGEISFVFNGLDFELLSKICANFENKVVFRSSPYPKLVLLNTDNLNKLKIIHDIVDVAFSYLN